MKPSFSCFLLLLLLLTLVSVSSAARSIHTIRASSSTTSLEFAKKQQAERLIRSLNLFPELDVNIDAKYDSQDLETKIVEKNFRFPNVVRDGNNITSSAGNGTSLEDFGHHAGYYRLPHSKGASMFYFFFESRNKNSSAPVVVWLTGGPGCSGSLALFHENGPFHLTKDLSLVWNEFGWDQASNLIYLDQPIGTGFTYSNDSSDMRSSTAEASVDFYDFLQAFFEKHPEYAKNDFYITGESYAGHYIPVFASLVQQKNKDKQGLLINFKGMAIGNGLTNPEIQYLAYPDFALDTKLIDKSQYDSLNESVSYCKSEIAKCGTNDTSSACRNAYADCNSIFREILSYVPDVNFYDIRKQCEGSLCYDFSDVENFLNEVKVKQALGVPNDIEFVSCSNDVNSALQDGDWGRNFEDGIPALLHDGIKVLIYAGEYDLICNWLGNSRWVDAMVWDGRTGYLSARLTPFKVDKLEAGMQKSYGPLTFLKVHNAGHLVPMDQPEASLVMLTRWMQGSPL